MENPSYCIPVDKVDDLIDVIKGISQFEVKYVGGGKRLYSVDVTDPKDDHPTNMTVFDPKARNLSFLEAVEEHGETKARERLLRVAVITKYLRSFYEYHLVLTNQSEFREYHDILRTDPDLESFLNEHSRTKREVLNLV